MSNVIEILIILGAVPGPVFIVVLTVAAFWKDDKPSERVALMIRALRGKK